MALATVFVTHITEDRELASAIKDVIEKSLAHAVKVFVSSDKRSLKPGRDWFDEIVENLKSSDSVIAILSPQSLARPWVNFESGAAYIMDKRLLPVCVRGLGARDIGPPLSVLQLLTLRTEDDVRDLVTWVAEPHELEASVSNLLARKVASLASPGDWPAPLAPEAKSQEPIIMSKIREDWDASTHERQVFWETLGAHYIQYCSGRSPLPDSIEELVDTAGPPPGIPLEEGKQFVDYPKEWVSKFNQFQTELFRFCSEIYPPKRQVPELKKATSLNPDQFDSFHSSRSILAKCWQRHAEYIYVSRIVELDTIIRYFPSHRRLLNILTYLEIALEQWTRDPGVGKQFLFRLNRDWERLR